MPRYNKTSQSRKHRRKMEALYRRATKANRKNKPEVTEEEAQQIREHFKLTD